MEKQHSGAKHIPFKLPYYNTTDYPLAVRNQILSAPYDEHEAILLRYHQFVVKEFFTRNPNQRGMGMLHGMGQGKTRLAVAITEFYREFDPTRKIVILSAKSLEANFKKEVIAYTKKSDDYVDLNYKFISLNASNMFKQVSNLNIHKDEADLEHRLGNFMSDISRNTNLENCMLIIDEAHNLFNSITNGAKNAVGLYDLIMNTKNLKIILLTGTAIINHPFELVPCFNMLRGYIEVDVRQLGGHADNVSGGDELTDSSNVDVDANVDVDVDVDEIDYSEQPESPTTNQHHSTDRPHSTNQHQKPKFNKNKQLQSKKSFGKKSNTDLSTIRTTLFSEDIDEFTNFFIDVDNKTIKNKDKFTNRIYGLASYYGDLYFDISGKKQDFPEELETIVEKVPMSQIQFARYMSARILELDESKKSFKQVASRFSSGGGGSSTYRVKTRQISNYCIPEYALGPARGAKSREKFIKKIKPDDLINTDDYSPKMSKIIDNINKHADQLGIVYSQFVSGEGLGIFSLVLKELGYNQYGNKDASGGEDFDIKIKIKGKTFAMLSGDITPEDRANIIKQFNSLENKNGNLIHLLLMSGAVSEGVDLKRVRHVHIMEPFWNYARINQVKTRAIRYMSHIDMPELERNVQTYVYLSDYPVGYPVIKIVEPTTDIDLYDKSLGNMKLINSFMLAVAESSIDCSIHYPKLDDEVKKNIQCKMCSPDNKQLFHPLLRKDMEIPSTCKPFVEKKVNVLVIKLPDNDEKFYYTKKDGNITIYHYNNKLRGIAPMLRNHPLYGDLQAAVILAE